MAAAAGDVCGSPAGAQPGAAAEARFISSAKGKGLFATRSIRKGETVFVERPVVASQFLWNALYNYRGEAKVSFSCCGFYFQGLISFCSSWQSSFLLEEISMSRDSWL
uniref:SET domain-containing protein n=1 Tax=Anas platyrhynchos platyrhynchos TaxID=8840 RepID=A0A493TS19_ANAPP